MKIFKKFLWSIRLDYTLLFKIKEIPAKEKIYFVIMKYIFFLRDVLLGLRGEVSSVKLLNKTYYYNNVYGIASLQRVYCESHYLSDFIHENSTIIDVGAHIGQFNFFCSNYLKAARVISIEPLKDCFEILKLNSDDPEDCINCAISNVPGLKTMYISKTSSELSSYIKDPSEVYEGEFRITTKTVDDIITERHIDTCDLLKIDTEGSEYDVIQSSQKSLSSIHTILIEMSVYRVSAGNLFTVGNFLQSEGFTMMKLLPRTRDLSYLDGIFQRRILS